MRQPSVSTTRCVCGPISLLLVLLLTACESEVDTQSGDSAGDTTWTGVCEEQLSSGAHLGIEPVPETHQDSYGQVFCKYTEVMAPNGDPIRIFAQQEISNEQMLYARSVLEFFLDDATGSKFGSDKTAIAN